MLVEVERWLVWRNQPHRIHLDNRCDDHIGRILECIDHFGIGIRWPGNVNRWPSADSFPRRSHRHSHFHHLGINGGKCG